MDSRVWNLLDSETMQWGGTWADAQSSIRSYVFGKMIDLSKDRIKHYQSDLYHDAMWLNEYLIGPMQIDWVVRESGTFIGEVTMHINDSEWEKIARYRFDIRVENDRKWVLDIYQAVSLKKEIPLDPYMGETEFISDGTFTEDDQGNWHSVKDTGYGSDEPDKQTLADAEDALKALDPISEIIESLFDRPQFPTYRNNTDLTSINTKEITTMDSILRDLREKASEAEEAKDELESKRYELDEAISELDSYVDEINGLIDSLDNLPEVSVSVEIDVSFDS